MSVGAADEAVTYGDPAPAYSSTTVGFLGEDAWITSPTCTSDYAVGAGVADSPLVISCSGGDAGPNVARAFGRLAAENAATVVLEFLRAYGAVTGGRQQRACRGLFVGQIQVQPLHGHPARRQAVQQGQPVPAHVHFSAGGAGGVQGHAAWARRVAGAEHGQREEKEEQWQREADRFHGVVEKWGRRGARRSARCSAVNEFFCT